MAKRLHLPRFTRAQAEQAAKWNRDLAADPEHWLAYPLCGLGLRGEAQVIKDGDVADCRRCLAMQARYPTDGDRERAHQERKRRTMAYGRAMAALRERYWSEFQELLDGERRRLAC